MYATHIVMELVANKHELGWINGKISSFPVKSTKKSPDWIRRSSQNLDLNNLGRNGICRDRIWKASENKRHLLITKY